MNDLLQGFFEGQDKEVNQKKFKDRELVEDPILFSKGEPNITILCEVPFTDKQLYGIKQELTSMGLRDNYQIVSALKFKPTEKDLTKEVVKLYKKNKFDLSEVIPEWSNVISIGRSLYSIIESDDLNIDEFKDTLLWHTSFFSPDLKCDVYPVDAFMDWYKKDNFEFFFFSKQVDLAMKNKPTKKRITKLKKHYVNNPNKWLLDRANDECLMAWDLETKGLNPWFDGGKIICMTVAFNSKEGFYLPWKEIDPNVLTQFFKTKRHIGTNLKFDQRWVVTRGVEFESLVNLEWDTMHASHTINEMQRNGLKSDTWLYTSYGGYDRELDNYQESHPFCKGDYSKIPSDILFEYATQDPIMSFATYERQKEIIEELDEKYPMDNDWSLMRYLREIRFPSCVMYADIEIKGMVINREKLRESSKVLRNQIKSAEDKVLDAFDLTREDINIHSTEMLGELIQKKGWRVDEWSKKGFPKVGAPQLKRWVKQGHKEAQLILDMVEKTTMFNNFVGDEQGVPISNRKRGRDNSPDLFESVDMDAMQGIVEGSGNGYFQYIGNDGLIHGSFLNMMANSHRNKSRNPNLQNQPSHGDKAFFIRQNICCPKWGKFLSADYSGLQLRIACILSGDKAMKKVFTEMGGDMHSMTAQSVVMNSSISLEEFLKRKREGDETIVEARFRAKICNFSLLFGTSAFSFARTSIYDEWDTVETKEFVVYHKLEDKVNRLRQQLVGEEAPNQVDDLDRSTKLSIFDGIGDKNHFVRCWAIALFFRERFFDKYKGLRNHLDRSLALANRDGYVRSVHGIIRRLPELYYQGKDSVGMKVKNSQNKALNSPVQSFETVVVNRWLLSVWGQTRERNMKSYIFGQIHDAGEMVSAIDEEEEFIKLVKEEGNKDYPEYNGIPLEVEANLADYWGTYEKKGWEVWDMGQEV